MVIEVERMVAVLEARLDKYEKAFAKAAATSDKALAGIEARGATFAAKMNAATAGGAQGFDKLSKALGGAKMQTANLSAQFQDIFVQLQGGSNPLTVALQQGSQISAVLGGMGASGAVSALGSAFSSLLNPVSLATYAIIALGGAAVQYFTQFLGDAQDSEEELKKHAELINTVATRWGEALPSLKRYNDELKRQQDEADKGAAVKTAATAQYETLRKLLPGINADLADLTEKMRMAGANYADIDRLQQAFLSFSEKVQKSEASLGELRAMQDAMNVLFRSTGVPAALQMAHAIGQYADEMERAAGAAAKLKAEAALQQFYRDSPLGTLSPLTSGGGQFLNPQQQMDFTAANTRSQFEIELDKAGGAIEAFVNRVIKAEGLGRNPNSSANGVGQFIESTWTRLFRQYFPDRAKGMTQSAILAMRNNADTARVLIEAYARENARVLQQAGVSVNEAALQLAHFLGAGDAAKVLKAAPGTPLAGLISGRSIAANPSVLGGGRTVDDAIAYAMRRANESVGDPTGMKTTRRKTPSQVFSGDMADVQRRIDTLNAEYEAQARLNPLVKDYGFELEKAKVRQQLLNDAQKAGLKITPELAAKIDKLAENYASASAATEQLQASQQKVADQAREFQDLVKDVLSGFIADLRAGKSASEALGNALDKVIDKLIDGALNMLLGGLFGGGGGGLFSLFGFAKGGVAAHGRPQPLPTFAKGGVSRSAAIFGEAGPEAAVPLPDGRNIPVKMLGGGSRDQVTINLVDDSGRMADIADKRIRTASGTIVRVAVQQTRQALPGMMSEAQMRSL